MSTVNARRPTVATELALGAALISFAPIFVKWVGTDSLGPSGIAFCRTLFGGLILLGVCCLGRRSLRLSRRSLTWAALAGGVFALDLALWHHSIIRCGAGLATILGNTQVFWSAVLARWIFAESLSGRFFVSAITGLAGVVLVSGLLEDGIARAPEYGLGVGLGVLTGGVYGTYALTLKAAERRTRQQPEPSTPDPVAFMAYASLCSAIALAPTAWLEGRMLPIEGVAVGKIVLLAIVAQAAGWLVIKRALPHLASARAGLILLLQPALATLWAALFFGESLSALQLAGMVVTLGSVYYAGIRKP